MYQPCAMGCPESVASLEEQAGCLDHGARLLHPLGCGPPRQVLRGHEGHVLKRTNFVDRQHVGMHDACDRSSFSLEAFSNGVELDCDLAVETEVLCKMHDPHPSSTKLANKLEAMTRHRAWTRHEHLWSPTQVAKYSGERAQVGQRVRAQRGPLIRGLDRR